ncbi:MFS transporter [Pseudomonas sp. N040]|uniref:MFS transporter n=1 Tax=Pseudomonas sp. N040 TaxID=2785325 RepID=UPI0018A2DE3B|nr:MFS transporter [Pseudomonas sp. N040]MBF7731553.1 MFS transporter [Pseudomonas sp. N040]MBW7015197.1 MFS transporter [Pseudomonas sp. N040]
MTENDYLLAWGAYAFAALGCLLVWCLMTGWMWRWLREPLRLLVLVLLCTPTVVDPGKDAFAPAIAIAAMDLLLDVGNNAWRAVADLATYGMIAFVLYLLFALLRWLVERSLKRRRQPSGAAKATAGEATLRQIMAQGETRIDAQGERRLRSEPRL